MTTSRAGVLLRILRRGRGRRSMIFVHGRATMRFGRIRSALLTAAHGPRAFMILSTCSLRRGRPPVIPVLAILVIAVRALVVAATHAHITTDANAAALLSNHTAELGALGQAGELLRAVDNELGRLDFHAPIERLDGGRMVHVADGREDEVRIARILVLVFLFLCLFVEVKAQPVAALVPDGKVRKQEVARLDGTVQIGHARYRHAGEDGNIGRRSRGATRVSHQASVFKGGIEEEVGIVVEGDILLLSLLPCCALEDAQLHDRRRINGATISRRCDAVRITQLLQKKKKLN